MSFDAIACDYGALNFQDALADFIAQLNYPGASRAALAGHAHNTHCYALALVSTTLRYSLFVFLSFP